MSMPVDGLTVMSLLSYDVSLVDACRCRCLTCQQPPQTVNQFTVLNVIISFLANKNRVKRYTVYVHDVTRSGVKLAVNR